MALELRPYQIKATKWLIRHPKAMLGSWMGTGKTAVLIKAAQYLVANKSPAPVFGPKSWSNAPQTWVVVPKSLKHTWALQLKLWAKNPNCQILKSSSDRIDSNIPWVIFTYDIYSNKSKKDLNNFPPPLVIIFDESHKLKSKKALRTQRAVGVGCFTSKIPFVYFASGTLLRNCLADIWAQVNFITKGKFGTYTHFIEQYCFIRKTKWGDKPFGQKNLPDLVEKLRPYLYCDTAEVLKEIPEYQESFIPLESTKRSIEIEKLLDDSREEIKIALARGDDAKNALHRVSKDKPHLATLLKESAIEKIPQTIEFAEDLLEQGLSVVIFAHHRQVIEELTTKLSENYSTASLYGKTPDALRASIVPDFQNGIIQCLIVSIGVGGEGLTLTKSYNAILVERPWVPEELNQLIGRLVRIGQTEPCNFYHLIFPGSVDEMVLEVNKEKRKVIGKFWDLFQKNPTGPYSKDSLNRFDSKNQLDLFNTKFYEGEEEFEPIGERR